MLTGLYIAVSSGAYVLGVSSIDFLSFIPYPYLFFIVLIVGVISIVPVLSSNKFDIAIKPSGQTSKTSLRFFSSIKYLLLTPLSLITIVIYGTNQDILCGLLPVYGEQMGLSQENAALMLSVFLSGAFVLLVFLGYVSDKIGYKKVLPTYSIILILGFIIMYFEKGSFFITWPMLFIIGGVSSVFYSIGLCILSNQYRGVILSAACAAFEIFDSISGMVGTPFIGIFMTKGGPQEFPLSLCLLNGLSFLCIISLIFYIARKSPTLPSS